MAVAYFGKGKKAVRELKQLFENNKRWASERLASDEDYFNRQSEGQRPAYLWIGCSDSRIPANEIVGLEPGQLFVHRNVANLCPHTDFNCLSVLEYAIVYLQIRHVIVCGHYGCGGVGAAMENQQLGLVDNWLRHIRDVYARHSDALDRIVDKAERYRKLVEFNVLAQVMNVCHTSIAQNAWVRGQPLSVHGWVYDIGTGRLNDLDCCVSSLEQVEKIYLTH